MTNEEIIHKLFNEDISIREKRRALAECEREGALRSLILKYHPQYILPNGEVMKMKILRDVGIPY